MSVSLLAGTEAERRLLPGGTLRGPTPYVIAIMTFALMIVAAAGLALANAAGIVAAAALVAHLGNYFVALSGLGQHPDFVNIVRQGLFYVNVLTQLHGSHGNGRVHMIGRTYNNGINSARFSLLQQGTVIFVIFSFRPLLAGFPGLPVVYVSAASEHEWSAQGVPASVMIAKPCVSAQVVVAISSLLVVSD